MDSNDWKQKALLPKLLTEEDASYNAVVDLQQALANDDICNIALTGPFGSGKSSVIHTLIDIERKRKDSKLTFLSISLATLDATKEAEDAPETTENYNNEALNRKIEYSILQQLIYREDHEILPNSRIKRIPHIPNKTIHRVSVSVIIFFICFCIVFEPQYLRVEILYRLFSWGYWVNGIFDILSLIIMGCMIYKACIFLIGKYGSSKLNQVKIAGGEIQIQDENSIFNHHLDEILYFFQCTAYNTVIIEDLDRFNTPDIFLKLRELNYLLNHSNIVGRKIKFVYAIKDDMFTDTSRTKFFDYITTVVPVISPYNSKDILRKALTELGHTNQEIDDATIREVAFFIDDMRLLQNIANEYHQYRLRLGCNDNHKIDNNKLLAMIVYKNYHPDSFALLPKRDGEIYKAICSEQKTKYQKIVLEQVLPEIKASVQKQKDMFSRNAHLNAVDLRKLYVWEYTQHMHHPVQGISVDGGHNYRSVSDFYEDEETFASLTNTTTISYKYKHSNGYQYSDSITVHFSNVEHAVDATHTYVERLAAIKNGNARLLQEESKLEVEESLINSYSIHRLVTQFNLYKRDDYKALCLSDMADRFIRIGLIAEDYYDYISIFYPGMISANDHKLILDMKLDRRPNFMSHIDNVATFLEELPDDVFLNRSVYNVELFDYISSHPVTEKTHYNLILDLLYTQESFDFVQTYYKEGKKCDDILKAYIQAHPQEIWNKIIPAKDYQPIMYEVWIKYCDTKDIQEVQLDWLSENYDLIAQIYDKLSKEKQKLLVTTPKYKTLADISADMLSKVVKNGCYAVSEKTISYVFEQKQAKEDISVLSNEEQKVAVLLNLPQPTWKNISIYFSGQGNKIDDTLWDFINQHHDAVCGYDYNGISEVKELLFQALMNSNRLVLQLYKDISTSFNGCYFNLQESDEGLENNRLIWLVQTGFVEYSEKNISLISNRSSEAFVEYLVYHKSHFDHDVDKYPYNADVANLILTSSAFTTDEKALVLTKLSSSNIIMTCKLANSICSFLEIKSVEWDFSLLKKAIAMTSDQDNAINITTLTIRKNDKDFSIITQLLQSLPDAYQKITENGKRPIIKETPTNKLLLDTLLQCGYISSYSPEDKGYRVNTRQKA